MKSGRLDRDDYLAMRELLWQMLFAEDQASLRRHNPGLWRESGR